jgi:hypothetical protein
MNNHSCLKILALALVLAAPSARAGLAHRYSFDDTVSTTNALDTVGGANGTLFGGVSITGGQAVFDGEGERVGGEGSISSCALFNGHAAMTGRNRKFGI